MAKKMLDKMSSNYYATSLLDFRQWTNSFGLLTLLFFANVTLLVTFAYCVRIQRPKCLVKCRQIIKYHATSFLDFRQWTNSFGLLTLLFFANVTFLVTFAYCVRIQRPVCWKVRPEWIFLDGREKKGLKDIMWWGSSSSWLVESSITFCCPRSREAI